MGRMGAESGIQGRQREPLGAVGVCAEWRKTHIIRGLTGEEGARLTGDSQS